MSHNLRDRFYKPLRKHTEYDMTDMKLWWQPAESKAPLWTAIKGINICDTSPLFLMLHIRVQIWANILDHLIRIIQLIFSLTISSPTEQAIWNIAINLRFFLLKTNLSYFWSFNFQHSSSRFCLLLP